MKLQNLRENSKLPIIPSSNLKKKFKLRTLLLLMKTLNFQSSLSKRMQLRLIKQMKKRREKKLKVLPTSYSNKFRNLKVSLKKLKLKEIN